MSGAAVLTDHDKPAIRAVLWEGVRTLSDSKPSPVRKVSGDSGKGGSGKAGRGGRRSSLGDVGHALSAAYQDTLREDIPALDGAAIQEERGGVFAMTMDGRLMVGPSSAIRGFWMATGCNGTGFSLSSGVGYTLAEWITTGSPSIDMSDLDPNRFGTVAISDEGVDFDSLDGEKVHLLFLLVSPPDRPGDHLRALENISRQLRDDTFCRFLKQAKTPQDVWQLLDEADSNQFGS